MLAETLMSRSVWVHVLERRLARLRRGPSQWRWRVPLGWRFPARRQSRFRSHECADQDSRTNVMAAKAAVDLTGADRLVQDVPPSGAKAQRQDGANGGSSNRALICKPPAWGEPLLESDYAVLALSWITQEIADEAMLRRIDAILGREVIGQKGNRDCSGILFPGYWPGEQYPHSYRIRRDNPDWTESSGKIKAKAKYLGAPGSANRLYIPPGVTPEQLADIKIAIVIVEGEK